MKFSRSRLVTVTPLILAAMANGAAAQDAANTGSTVLQNVQTVNADAEQGTSSILPLQITIPASGTYVFSAPAVSGIQLAVDGQELFASSTTTDDEPIKALISMAAGTHNIEVSGDGITMAALADVTANLLGMPEASIMNIASAAVETDTTSPFSSVRTAAAATTATSEASTFEIDTSTTPAVRVASTATVTASDALSGTSGDRGIVSTPSTDRNEREDVSGILRNTIRDAVTAAIADEPTTTGTVVIGASEAQSSALSPPTGVALVEAVEIVGGATDDGVVASQGQTMFGAVMDPATYDMVTVTLEPGGRETTVDVGPTTGQFAFRIFPEDLTTGSVSVTLVAGSSADETIVTTPVAYEYQSGRVVDGVSEALSRLTYGPDVNTYSRVRTMGFENYVNEQLNPDDIRDAAFDAFDVDAYFDDLGSNFGTVRDSEMSHRISYAAYSDKQLQEVMGDFWSNHFFASTKSTGIRVQNITDRQFYRDNAFGNFEDLLLYSARSPLMSQFLDNDQSRVDNINENYGREILELHTVGVDGGYGDDDVVAVSRIFTGWLYEQTNANGSDQGEYDFLFDEGRHDTDDKEIPFLNTTVEGRSGAAGVQEGEELIAILADDPRTHEYVCGKIVQRFVADDAPAEFIDICTAAWAANDGDTGEVLRAILLAPEFLEGAAARGTKAKTPYEYAISVLRTLGIEIDSSDGTSPFNRIRDAAADAGYAPLDFDLPTGLDETADTWINSASILASYVEITEVVNSPNTYDIDLGAMVDDAGLETAEEVAAFFMALATADVYTREEYEALVGVLKGEDGIFEPGLNDETAAYERASGLIVVLPSFYLQ